jgi:hypothetical protein
VVDKPAQKHIGGPEVRDYQAAGRMLAGYANTARAAIHRSLPQARTAQVLKLEATNFLEKKATNGVRRASRDARGPGNIHLYCLASLQFLLSTV